MRSNNNKNNEGNKPFNDFCCLFSLVVYCSAFVWECSFGLMREVYFLYRSTAQIAARTKEKQATTKWKHRKTAIFSFRLPISDHKQMDLLQFEGSLVYFLLSIRIMSDLSRWYQRKKKRFILQVIFREKFFQIRSLLSAFFIWSDSKLNFKRKFSIFVPNSYNKIIPFWINMLNVYN